MKSGKPKIVGIFAKKARGKCARFIIKNQITKPEEIKKFRDITIEFINGNKRISCSPITDPLIDVSA